MFDPQIARDIVQTLIKEPLPLHEALQRWGDNPTWYELVDKKQVTHSGCMAVATSSGRASYEGS